MPSHDVIVYGRHRSAMRRNSCSSRKSTGIGRGGGSRRRRRAMRVASSTVACTVRDPLGSTGVQRWPSMSSDATVSWRQVTSWRRECYDRYGSIHDMPIVDVSRELTRLVGSARNVLDFGAGTDKPLRARIPDGAGYWSLDPDPEGDFDFTALSDVPADQRFDLVVADQVLEHLQLADAVDVARGIAGVLEPGGRFVATV